MNKCIIYPNKNGGICVIIPAPQEFCQLSIDEIAKKDVEAGAPYLIINHSDLPSDNLFRDSWICDFQNPDGYGIGNEAWFAGKNMGV